MASNLIFQKSVSSKKETLFYLKKEKNQKKETKKKKQKEKNFIRSKEKDSNFHKQLSLLESNKTFPKLPYAFRHL